MKTQFVITADTSSMKVTLAVRQGGRIKWMKDCESVTQACQMILNGIGSVMEKHND